MPQRPRTLLLPCLVEGLQEWLIRGSLPDCRAGAPLAQFDFADDKLIWTSSARGADARENSPKPTGVQATDKVHTRVCSCADMQQACLAFVPSFRPVILRWRKQFFCVRRPQAGNNAGTPVKCSEYLLIQRRALWAIADIRRRADNRLPDADGLLGQQESASTTSDEC